MWHFFCRWWETQKLICSIISHRPHSHLQNLIVQLYELQMIGYQFKSTSGVLSPTKEVLHTCKIVLNIFNRQFTLGHFVAMGQLTFPNLNISTIWVRDPWVSIQINFWVSLPPTKEVPHTCKIVNYF